LEERFGRRIFFLDSRNCGRTASHLLHRKGKEPSDRQAKEFGKMCQRKIDKPSYLEYI